MEPGTVAISLGGVATLVAVTGLVYRDATRIDLERPALWAGLVAVTWGVALATFLAVDAVPLPGLLVIAVFGPAVYLFERDDARHGDEPPDPRTLADEPADPGSPPDESATDPRSLPDEPSADPRSLPGESADTCSLPEESVVDPTPDDRDDDE